MKKEIYVLLPNLKKLILEGYAYLIKGNTTIYTVFQSRKYILRGEWRLYQHILKLRV